MKILYLFRNALVAFLDFSAGIFIVSAGSLIAGRESSIVYYIIGGALALAPDFDVFYMYLKRGEIYGDHHQYFTHRPIVGLPLAALIGFAVGGLFWCAVAIICVFWHYVHDTEGPTGGGGIAWFWPFSEKYRSPWKTSDPKQSLSGQAIGRQDELLESEWLAPSARSVSELVAGTILFSVAAANLFNWFIGIVCAAIIWLGITSVWGAYALFKARSL